MRKRFEVILLEEVWELLDTLEEKVKDKILYNLEKSKYINDPELLKKLNDDIWEFRSKYRSLQYRLLSFWDKTENSETLIVSTHGIIKKTDKVPKREIEKARQIMKKYFDQKKKK
ncbi:MAG: type II toxin-antitoxin system RelE/ParE family toxin [Bacteroidales bacterium]|nr:type II toxin-antitoxin system RelE/ParE family toxin [Bacteroidales bacterium]MCF6341703.1 type II toxin-antitoxin system RelE/ParE family toxin [Bacteroidales bacterium]